MFRNLGFPWLLLITIELCYQYSISLLQYWTTSLLESQHGVLSIDRQRKHCAKSGRPKHATDNKHFLAILQSFIENPCPCDRKVAQDRNVTFWCDSSSVLKVIKLYKIQLIITWSFSYKNRVLWSHVEEVWWGINFISFEIFSGKASFIHNIHGVCIG